LINSKLAIFVLLSTVFHFIIFMLMQYNIKDYPSKVSDGRYSVYFFKIADKKTALKNNDFKTTKRNRIVKESIKTNKNSMPKKEISNINKTEQIVAYKNQADNQTEITGIEAKQSSSFITKTLGFRKEESSYYKTNNINGNFAFADKGEKQNAELLVNFDVENYSKYALSVIRNVLDYPYFARKRGIEGDVEVLIKVSKGGKLEDLKLIKSSGYNILDENTLKLAGKVDFERKPPDNVEFPVKISYRLNQ